MSKTRFIIVPFGFKFRVVEDGLILRTLDSKSEAQAWIDAVEA